MAISELAEFSSWRRSTYQTLIQYNINLFNAATKGGIILSDRSVPGAFEEESFFPAINNIVELRDAYDLEDIEEVRVTQDKTAKVKIAAGTKELTFERDDFTWTGQPAQIAGVKFGEAMAEQVVNDMLKASIAGLIATLQQDTATYLDVSGYTTPAVPTMTYRNMLAAKRKLGDKASRIRAWLMHSKTFFDQLDENLKNGAALFSFGEVNVYADSMGTPIIVSDFPGFEVSGDYYSIGLTEGAAVVERQNDFDENEVRKNGKTKIVTSYQATWSYLLGIKGAGWDIANGGKSPNLSAIGSSENWNLKLPPKERGGVLLRSQ